MKSHVFPQLTILSTVRGYSRIDLRRDLIAALVVWTLVVPQSIAYAHLAGLSSAIGIWAAVGALLGYALFGSARFMSVGPTAATSAMTGVVLAYVASRVDPDISITSLAVLLAMLVSMCFAGAWILRVGRVIDFVAEPVVIGYMAGLGLTVIVSQLPKLLGAQQPNPGNIVTSVIDTLATHPNFNGTAAVIGLASLVILVATRFSIPKLPLSIVVVALGVVLSWMFDLADRGVVMVGEVSSAPPLLSFPTTDIFDTALLMFPGAIAVAVVGYLETVSVGRRIARHNRQVVEINSELAGLSAANLGSALFGGYPVDGSVTRTTAANAARMRTQVSSLILAGLLVISIVVFAPVFKYLPQAVLAAIVITAVLSLLAPRPFRRLRHLDHFDFVLAATSCILVLLFGAITGLLSGIVLSLGGLAYRTYRPRIVELGLVEGRHEHDESFAFRDIAANKEFRTYPGLRIIRFEQELCFANIRVFGSFILEGILNHEQPVRVILVDAAAITAIDSTAMIYLHQIMEELAEAEVELWLARASAPLIDGIVRAGLDGFLPGDNRFLTVRSGVSEYVRRWPESVSRSGDVSDLYSI